jgi:hypothetical protein
MSKLEKSHHFSNRGLDSSQIMVIMNYEFNDYSGSIETDRRTSLTLVPTA